MGGLGGLPGVSDGTRLGEGQKPESNMIYSKGEQVQSPQREVLEGKVGSRET